MSRNVDVVIIGGGIIGAACAHALKQAGKRVLVLEANKIGIGVTSSSMGHVVVMDDSEAQFDFCRYSQLLWREHADRHKAICRFYQCGTIWIAEDEEEMSVVIAKAEVFKNKNTPVEILDCKTLYQYEPNLKPGLMGGLRVLEDCSVYAPGFTRLLLAEIDVEENCQVKSIGDHQVTLADETVIEADVVINAAGAAASALTPGLPIEPRKGHLVVTERNDDFCTHQLVELGYIKRAHEMTKESVAFNIHPTQTGQYLVGSSREFVDFDESINRDLLQQMLRRACDYMPSLSQLSMLRTWVGFRPATRDGFPLIGRWPKVAGLYIAAGHEGLGITTSLATAGLLTAEILGEEPAVPLGPFRPDRQLEVN